MPKSANHRGDGAIRLSYLIVSVLGLLAAIAMLGALMLANNGKPVPDWMGNVISGIVGALAGALVTHRLAAQTPPEPEPVSKTA